jgi:hypothetical protein
VIQLGYRYRFAYPAQFTSLPDHTLHAGHTVTVLRELGAGESDHHADPTLERMFEIRADDGWTGHAFESELRPLAAETT